jgi:hypothetical protein
MMNDSKFSFNAAIITIALSVIIAIGIIWAPHNSLKVQEGARSVIHKPYKNLVVTFQKSFQLTSIAQDSKALPIISSEKPSYNFTSQPHATVKKDPPSVTIRTQRSNITIFPQLNENETHHIISRTIKPNISTSKIQNATNSTTGLSLKNITSATNNTTAEHIAFIAPTFTTAAYNNKFYNFYRLEKNVAPSTNVTKNLNLLTSRVIDLPPKLIKHAYLGLTSNLQIITDQDVDDGSIFIQQDSPVNSTNNTAANMSVNRNIQHQNSGYIDKYDILILAHQEYVTQREYDNLRHFVENGGTIILLDGNVFYAQVSYDRHHHSITLVKGHGWAFNGITAWKSVSERWAKETSEWIGSNYLCYSCEVTFANDPWEYKHHEEQYITNHNDIILINYGAKLVTKYPVNYKPVIATYELHYKKGLVIGLGLYSDDIVGNMGFDKYFHRLLAKADVS